MRKILSLITLIAMLGMLTINVSAANDNMTDSWVLDGNKLTVILSVPEKVISASGAIAGDLAVAITGMEYASLAGIESLQTGLNVTPNASGSSINFFSTVGTAGEIIKLTFIINDLSNYGYTITGTVGPNATGAVPVDISYSEKAPAPQTDNMTADNQVVGSELIVNLSVPAGVISSSGGVAGEIKVTTNGLTLKSADGLNSVTVTSGTSIAFFGTGVTAGEIIKLTFDIDNSAKYGYTVTGTVGPNAAGAVPVSISYEGAAKTGYTVTFDSTGGNAVSSQTTGTDGKLASLPASTKTGFTFNGWFTAATGGTKVDTSTVFTANTTVYAQWTAVPVATTYTVTFDSVGGNAVSSQTTGTDGKLASLPTSTKTGFTFNGWFTAATGGTKVDTSTVFTANTTVYAQWKEQNTDGNQSGGSNTPETPGTPSAGGSTTTAPAKVKDDAAIEDDDSDDLGTDDGFDDDINDDDVSSGNTGNESNKAQDTTNDDGNENSDVTSNAKTGVGFVIIPAAVAGISVVFTRKRK